LELTRPLSAPPSGVGERDETTGWLHGFADVNDVRGRV
jgi:hypothetical protein